MYIPVYVCIYIYLCFVIIQQVSTPVRVHPSQVPSSPRQFPPTPPTTASKATSPLHVQVNSLSIYF